MVEPYWYYLIEPPHRKISQGGQMNGAIAFHSEGSRNLKIVGSSADPVVLKPGQIKPMTLILILVAS